jgi:ATP synthase protein I
MQDNLDRGTPAVLVSYGLIGAIIVLGGAGYLLDRYFATQPWGLVGGLIVGLCIGFFRLVRVLRT